MGAVKDLYYDIEAMFIEGHTASEIAKELNVPIEQVKDVLDDFGVEADDVDAADWDELEAFEADDYYGA